MENEKNVLSENSGKNNEDLKKEKEKAKLLIYRPIKKPKKNNLKYNKDFLESSDLKNIEEYKNGNILTNNESTKPNPLINFVTKNEKSKNLHVFKGKHDLPIFGTNNNNDKKDNKKILIKNILLNDNNKNENGTKNDTINNKKDDKNKNDKINNKKDDKNKNDKKSKDNIDDKNKNIITNKKKEEEKADIDEKKNKKINDNECIKIKLPIPSLCHFKKCTIIYSNKKYKLPIITLCHFSKSKIFTKRKYNYPIVNNYYFCTKINKKNDKKAEKSFSIESCIVFDFLNSKTLDIDNNNKKKQSLKSGNIQINNNKNDENRKNSSTSNTKRINNTNESKSKFENPKKKSNERTNRYKSESQNSTLTSISKKRPKKEKEEKTGSINKNNYRKRTVNKKVSPIKEEKNYTPKARRIKTDKNNNIKENNKSLNSSLSNSKSTKKDKYKNKFRSTFYKQDGISKKKDNYESVYKFNNNRNRYFSSFPQRNANNENKDRINKNVLKKLIKKEENKSDNRNNYYYNNDDKSNNMPKNKRKTNDFYNNDYSKSIKLNDKKNKNLNIKYYYHQKNNEFIKNNKHGRNNDDNYFYNMNKNGFYNYEKKQNINSSNNMNKNYINSKNELDSKNKYLVNDNEYSSLGKDKKYINIKYIMPKIKSNNRQNQKSTSFMPTQSSKYLLNKINMNKNDNNLFSITNQQNSNFYNNLLLSSQIKNNQSNNYALLNENINKEYSCDRHFGNEANCPKCQSWNIKINLMLENQNILYPSKTTNYRKSSFNSFNKALDSFNNLPHNNNNMNYNIYRNSSNHILTKYHKNNSMKEFKKIDISKYSEQIFKNNQSKYMAIKQYFNIK